MIVLDTHAWLWWASDAKKLSARAREAIESAKRCIVPAICCWEVAMLVAHGRLTLDRDALTWMRQALGMKGAELAPLTPEIAVGAAGFGRALHGDPADRLILATAQVWKVPLVSADRALRAAKGVQTIW